MENLDVVVENLEVAIKELFATAEHFYSAGDNYRGNIRHDAAIRLSGDLERITVARDYIALALKK